MREKRKGIEYRVAIGDHGPGSAEIYIEPFEDQDEKTHGNDEGDEGAVIEKPPPKRYSLYLFLVFGAIFSVQRQVFPLSGLLSLMGAFEGCLAAWDNAGGCWHTYL